MLKSSVSPEFRNGLQAKYLQYIADAMQLPLSIYPITYQERIKLLQAGKIDIMVGLKKLENRGDDLIYIEPSYEQVSNHFFVMAKDSTHYQSLNDLAGKTVAFTEDNNDQSIKVELEKLGIKVLRAQYLQQKIDLLLKGRVDAFVHLTTATQTKLTALGLDDKITLANVPPFSIRHYFLALSKRSPLVALEPKFTVLIQQALVNGDFKRLRQAHYAELAKSQLNK